MYCIQYSVQPYFAINSNIYQKIGTWGYYHLDSTQNDNIQQLMDSLLAMTISWLTITTTFDSIFYTLFIERRVDQKKGRQ